MRAQDDESLEADVCRRLLALGFKHVHAESLDCRDWRGVISFATTNEYWRCFDVRESLMSDAEFATTVREIWVATNGLPPDDAEHRLLKHGRNIPSEMWMSAEDAATLSTLPEQITIYRGGPQGCPNDFPNDERTFVSRYFLN